MATPLETARNLGLAAFLGLASVRCTGAPDTPVQPSDPPPSLPALIEESTNDSESKESWDNIKLVMNNPKLRAWRKSLPSSITQVLVIDEGPARAIATPRDRSLGINVRSLPSVASNIANRSSGSSEVHEPIEYRYIILLFVTLSGGLYCCAEQWAMVDDHLVEPSEDNLDGYIDGNFVAAQHDGRMLANLRVDRSAWDRRELFEVN